MGAKSEALAKRFEVKVEEAMATLEKLGGGDLSVRHPDQKVSLSEFRGRPAVRAFYRKPCYFI